MASGSKRDYDFNIIVCCIRNRERNAVLEVEDLIGNVVGDNSAEAEVTGIRSLVVARTSLRPREAIEKLRISAIEDPWRFQYTLKYIPIDVAVPTELKSIVDASKTIVPRILKGETFRVTCSRRHSQLRCSEIIKAVAALIDRKVDLEKPDKVLQIEILGERTGLAVLEDQDVFSLSKL
jgi:tRNA acetyltransferase TAN1